MLFQINFLPEKLNWFILIIFKKLSSLSSLFAYSIELILKNVDFSKS